MSREVGTKSNALPFLNLFDTADGDLTSVDANQAPVRLPIPPNDNFLRLTIAGDNNAATPIWHLVLTETKIKPDTAGDITDPMVIAYIPWTTQTITTSRQMHANNGGGFFLHHPLNAPAVIDLRGMPIKSKEQQWYLALEAKTGEAANLYLLAWESFASVPS